jgi:hypothetical protein
MDTLVRRANAPGYPGQSIIRANVTSAESLALPIGWAGKFIEITAIGADVYARIGETVVTVDKTNMSALANDDDADGLVTSIATSAAGRDFDEAADFNGVVPETAISPPRQVTITFNNHADHNAGTAKVFGKDAFGRTIISTLACADGGNETVTTSEVYSVVTRVTTPAAAAGGGTITVGVADSGAITHGGDEPHVYVASGQSKHVKLGQYQRYLSHIASAATGTVIIALASIDD